MGKRKQGHRSTGFMTALIAALMAALMLSVPAAAATCTASDVMIRNSGQERDDNIIGVLNEGDKVTVLSKSVDASGTEWYYIELPNKNTGYVKAKWIDNGGADVKTVQPQVQEEKEEKKEEEAPEQEAAKDSGSKDEKSDKEEESADQNDSDGLDDWTQEDADALAGTPVSDDAKAGKQESDQGTGVSDSQSALPAQNENSYDPYTDPDAQYSLNYVNEKDGTGSWYVYNYDTDRRIRLADLDRMNALEKEARKNASSAGIWRTIACILLLLLVGILAFLFIVLKRNTRTPSPRNGRSRRQDSRRHDSIGKASIKKDPFAPGDEEEIEEDEFSPDRERDDRKVFSEKISEEFSEESSLERPVSEKEAEEGSGKEKSSHSSSSASGDEEEEGGEEEEDEEEEEEKPVRRGKLQGLFGGRGRKTSRLFDTEDAEDDGSYEDEEDDSDEEEDYDEEDDEEDEEDVPRRGGFFGILKNIFRSDDSDDSDDEDDDEDEDYEDEDEDGDYEDGEKGADEEERRLPASSEEDHPEEEEVFEEETVRRGRGRGRGRGSSRASERNRARRQRAAERVFDEALDYPEDADLIPDSVRAREDADLPAEAGEPREAKEPKKAGDPGETGDQDQDLFFSDDDDDMEYSFLNSRAKRNPRR